MSESDAARARETRRAKVADEFKVMGLFIDNAKTYTQLSGAALALSVTFIREILGVAEGRPIRPGDFLVASWVCFLVAIGGGVTYQFYAVKYLELNSRVRTRRGWPQYLVRQPWPLYLLMLLAFYSGAVLFTLEAITTFR
jgi:hypothetical protein